MLWATVDATETVSSSSASVRPRAELQGKDTVTVYVMGGNLTYYLHKTTGSEVHVYDYKLSKTAGLSRGLCKRIAYKCPLGENADHIEPIRTV